MVHILPFFPYSSDDGFAVMNYYEVNQTLGTWEDIPGRISAVSIIFFPRWSG